MSSLETALPAGFQDLEQFVPYWARPNAAERAGGRSASSAAERQVFYAAAKERLAMALAYLDGKGVAQFGPEDERLMNLMLGLAHCAQAVEVQGAAEATHAELRQRLAIVRASADPP